MRSCLVFLAVASSLVFNSHGFAQWGDVEIAFIYDGKPPEPKLIRGGRLPVPPSDEMWVVDKNGGVKNVVVRLVAEKDVVVPVHPDFEKAKGTNVRIDIFNGRFEPHITIKYTNQNVLITNSDAFGHNVKGDFFDNKSFNLPIPAKGKVLLDAEKDGLNQHDVAGYLRDSIYPEMNGRLFVHSHPYAAVSDEHGRVTLKNVPVGDWTFVMWHEADGFIKKGNVDGIAMEWPKGRIKVKVEPKLNSLGTVAFKQKVSEQSK